MGNSTDDHNSKDFLSMLKFSENFATVLLVLSVIAFIGYALSPLLVNIFDPSAQKGIEASSLGFTIMLGSGIIEKFPASYFTISYLFSCAAILIAAIIIGIVRSILKDILKNNTPFTASVPRKIRLIAVIMAVYLVLDWLAQAASYFVLTNKEFLSSQIKGIKFSSSVNLNFTFIFVVGLIFLLSLIFDYGLYLKKDNESIV